MTFRTVDRYMRLAAALTLAAFLGFGCVPPKKAPAPAAPAEKAGQKAEEKAAERPFGYEEAAPAEVDALTARLSPKAQGLKSWKDLEAGLTQSLRYVRGKPAQAQAVGRPDLPVTWARVGASIERLLELLPELDKDPGLLKTQFTWLKVSPNTLLTGYYEPWLAASLKPRGEFNVPLYGVPDDLRSVDLSRFNPQMAGQTLVYRQGKGGNIEPYPDREAIDSLGALKGKKAEIAWAKDPVEVFFLQVQGSGRLVLPDGKVKHVLYAGKNGRQYVSLGKLLVDRGVMTKEEVTMQSLKKYLRDRPSQITELLNANPSYVFFRLADQGPFGSMGALLTPMGSFAVDPAFMPLGGIMAMSAELPGADGAPKSFAGLGLAQDVGGAIKGNRVDLFCGSDPEAERLAGNLKHEAAFYLLMSKNAGPSEAPAGK